MNRTAKGNRTRRKAIAWLEGQGYEVQIVERSGRYVSPRDVWGADLVAVRDDILCAVQVKSNRGDLSRARKELRAGAWPTTVVRLILVFEDRQEEPIQEVC